MPSIKEIYNSIGEVELNAESINLNVDGLEALASTQQADIAEIKNNVSPNTIQAVIVDGLNDAGFITDVNGGVANKLVQIGFRDTAETEDMLLVNNTNQKLPVDASGTVDLNNVPPIMLIGSDGNRIDDGGSIPVSGTINTDTNISSAAFSGTVGDSAPSQTISIGVVNTNSGLISPISEQTSMPVTANAGTGTFSVSDRGTTGEGTVSSFTSTTSTTLKASNSSRKLLTIYNEGAGNLHVLYGIGTASTTNYSVKLATGDYLEVDKYTGQLTAIFASAGTARVTEIT